ncbi:MAG: menaquinol oxidoreductase [candidate division Zixibacteria bacterium]|nr:menaquinol oxidoreductase [candidate division Zixibacteria bacterium]
MSVVLSLFAIAVLVILPLIGTGLLQLEYLFGVIIPYAAIILFLVGMIYRILKWANVPVPFRIPTSCGQQQSLSWIKQNELDNPSTFWGTVKRMALEVLFFRSLFRNTKVELREGPRISYTSDKWLWLGALAFHWSFLIIFVRHFKFFAEPVPIWVDTLQLLDGFFQIGLPIIYVTDAVILAALTYLFLRRIFNPLVRYISLINDYFPLLLLMGIAATGILLRYFLKTDIVAIKELGMGLISLHPVVPDNIGALFYIHLFLVSVLFAYFPFSKLMHMPGVFLSPTRNMANNSRMRRHINPWNYPVKTHTYEEYEDEFRDLMRAAGLPLEKDK